MKRQTWFPAALAAILLLVGAPMALACGAWCPRGGTSQMLGLGLFTAVGVIGAAWILGRKTNDGR